MPDPCEIRIYDQNQLVFTGTISRTVKLGRQRDDDASLFVESTAGRMAIAGRMERTIPREYLQVTPLSDDRLRVENLTSDRSLRLDDGSEIAPKQTGEVRMPIMISLGAGKALRILPLDETEVLRSLPDVTIAPGKSRALQNPLQSFAGNEELGRSAINWLQASMDVFQSAATSSDFFAKAARAVVETAGLSSARILLLKNGAWESEAYYDPSADGGLLGSPPSTRVLSRVQQERRTLWDLPKDMARSGGSLLDVDAVVAAPILDKNGAVIGALYGDRRLRSGAPAPTVTELEAMLVELVSCAVAAGLARMEQEQAAMRAHVQFEQFFTPELARQLAAQPDLLEGRDCEVTVLFCDIRGFSGVSERLGPAKTVQWLRDVMGVLSDCVLAHNGVLVDYIGDELMAMWGAPEDEPQHAALACKAGLEMLHRLPSLNAQWKATLGTAMDLGIGINSGAARVGNTGSKHKFKYGPLGNTVNLASRVQGATKYLRGRLLITSATQSRLSDGFMARRLCPVRVVNIVEPVVLYELAQSGEAGWGELKRAYEKAFDEFERGDFRNSAQTAAKILATHPDDGPTIILLARVAQCLANADEVFDPVWELPGK